MPKAAIDVQYLIDFLTRLLRTPSPTGNTSRAIRVAEEAFSSLGLQTRRTNKGALVAILPGRSDTRPRALSGHVDTLGAMVKEIVDDGRLRLAQLGGYVWKTVEGEYCQIETAEAKVYTGTVLAHKTAVHTYTRTEIGEAKAIEAEFSTVRFTRIYEGVVRVISGYETIFVMMCEGTGQACKLAENAIDFFDSFETDNN